MIFWTLFSIKLLHTFFICLGSVFFLKFLKYKNITSRKKWTVPKLLLVSFITFRTLFSIVLLSPINDFLDSVLQLFDMDVMITSSMEYRPISKTQAYDWNGGKWNLYWFDRYCLEKKISRGDPGQLPKRASQSTTITFGHQCRSSLGLIKRSVSAI